MSFLIIRDVTFAVPVCALTAYLVRKGTKLVIDKVIWDNNTKKIEAYRSRKQNEQIIGKEKASKYIFRSIVGCSFVICPCIFSNYISKSTVYGLMTGGVIVIIHSLFSRWKKMYNIEKVCTSSILLTGLLYVSNKFLM